MKEIFLYKPSKGFERINSQDFKEKDHAYSYLVMYLEIDEFLSYAHREGICQEVVDQINEADIYKTYTLVEENFTFFTIDLLDVDNKKTSRDLIGVYLERDRLIIVDVYDLDLSTRRDFLAVTKRSFEAYSPASFLNAFFSKLVSGHQEVYEDIKLKIEDIDDMVMENVFDRDLAGDLSYVSHKTLQLYSNYQRLLAIAEILEDNTNQIMGPDDLGSISNLVRKLERYKSNISYLSGYLSHVKDSYQAQLDIRLNKSMKLFTIIATVFTPLSFIAAWYGMNFNHMPEFKWIYGYPFVIGLSIIVALISIFIFKKMDK